MHCKSESSTYKLAEHWKIIRKSDSSYPSFVGHTNHTRNGREVHVDNNK
jgi:hypothetical protein